MLGHTKKLRRLAVHTAHVFVAVQYSNDVQHEVAAFKGSVEIGSKTSQLVALLGQDTLTSARR
jgi:hypothetical protein